MKVYGNVTLSEGSDLKNLTIDHGSSFPANGNVGELFTFQERIAVDNFAGNPNISAQNKAILSTIMKDLDVSGEVQLDNPDVAQGVQFLEAVGLLSQGRSAQILSNTPI